MRLPSRRTHRLGRVAAAVVVTGLGVLGVASAPVAGAATDATLAIVLDGQGGAITGGVEVSCQSPAVPAAAGTDIGTAARTAREPFSVPASGTTTLLIADLSAGTACAVTASGPTAAALGAVDGGTPLVGADGQLRGVAVTVDRGTAATAHLTFQVPLRDRFVVVTSRGHHDDRGRFGQRGFNTAAAAGE